MVSFFRKKKKSAEAAKDEEETLKTTTTLGGPSQAPLDPIVAVEAHNHTGFRTYPISKNAGSNASNNKIVKTTTNTERFAAMTSDAVNPAAVTGAGMTTTLQSQRVAKTSSYPRRNFLAGSLKGSRSSVSRLPAVLEEIHPIDAAPRSSSMPSTPNRMNNINNRNNSNDDETPSDEEGTPSTVPSTSTPDLLGSLSFDGSEGHLEILTPSAKAEIVRQLFTTPSPQSKESRIASMEVSPDGIVSQLGPDEEEDPDILTGTTNSAADGYYYSSPTAAASKEHTVHHQQQDIRLTTTGTTSMMSSQSGGEGDEPGYEQEGAAAREVTPRKHGKWNALVPKKTSPLFVRVKDSPDRIPDEGEEEESVGDEQDVSEEEEDTGDSAGAQEEGEHNPDQTSMKPRSDSTENAAVPVTPGSVERDIAVEDESPFVPTRTISLEQNRENLVSPLTMQRVGSQRGRRPAPNTSGSPDHDHAAFRQQRTLEEGDDGIIIEEDGTYEETIEDTYTYDREGTLGSTDASNTISRSWSKTEYYDDQQSRENPATMVGRKINEVAQQFMESLQCTPERIKQVQKNPVKGAMSMFYDGMCKPEDMDENPRRPYFDEEFAQRFVKRMLTTGMSLLYLQPPHTASNPSDDWKGRTVVMKIVPGSTGDAEAIQPKLQWTTMPGGTVTKSFLTSLSLLKIHSVLTVTQNLVPEESTAADLDEEDLCFISITSSAGRIYVFEANSVRERDEIANGLRNVIARLSFHLVAGDHQASTELYNDDRVIKEDKEPGDLPALANPKLNMNRMTHIMLET